MFRAGFAGSLARFNPTPNAFLQNSPWPSHLFLSLIAADFLLYLLSSIICIFERLFHRVVGNMSELLINSHHGHIAASKRIPAIARPFVSERAAKTLDIVRHCCLLIEMSMRYS